MAAPYTPVRILATAAGSAIVAAVGGMFLSLFILGLLVDASDGGEGAVLGFILIALGMMVVVGPITFFVVCTIGSRRSGHVMRRALPVIGLVCFAPTVLVLLVLLTEFPGKRGLQWLIPVVVAVVVIAMVVWLLESVGRAPTSTAMVVSAVALFVVVAGFAGSAANADSYRRGQRHEALSAQFSTMYLLSESVTGPQIWETSQMWAADPVSNPNSAGLHVTRFANAQGHEVELKLKPGSERTHCEWLLTEVVTCRVVLMTDSGRRVEYERYGAAFYDTTIEGRYVPLRTTDDIALAEIEALVEALVPVTVDEWLDELERRSD